MSLFVTCRDDFRYSFRIPSLFSMCLFAVVWAVNHVDAFRYRVLADGRVVFHERIDPVCLALQDDKTITAVRVPYTENFDAFHAVRNAEEQATLKAQPEFHRGAERGVIFVSCTPWLAFTAMTHPCALGNAYDSIPRITLGKYTRHREGRAAMPVDIHAHHDFVDGFRLGEFFRWMDTAPLSGLRVGLSEEQGEGRTRSTAAETR